MAMLRFRRYRVFVFAAAVFLFLVFRLSQNSQLGAHHTTIYKGYSPLGSESGPDSRSGGGNNSNGNSRGSSSGAGAAPFGDAAVVEVTKPAENEATPKEQPMPLPQLHTSLEVKGSYGLPTGHHSPKPAAPQQTEASAADSERIHQVKPPGAFQETTVVPVVADATAAAKTPIHSTSTIHWMKMADHFPIPEESLILLPTGSPKPIPRIQHRFKAESDSVREIRESRLASVLGEMQHAWSGYRNNAWTHDELLPVSKGFRDPFCGWAASLVDALDTLYIMKMYDEFDEAYEAIKEIDFTTTPFRSEIPVFETIIRYLGGFIAAYDVSGGSAGKYPALLTKAVELAEILMGVFDTPNRMPILYYNWKPAFFSQPAAAATSVSVAELGTMSMEFTRLAQLTGHHKYYDAIARITDAFEDWQNRINGTALPGVFPEHVDASGCNRTAAALQEAANASKLAQSQIAAANDTESEPVGYKPSQPDPDAMAVPEIVKQTKTMPPDLEFRVNPASTPGNPATGEFHKVGKRDLPTDSSPAQIPVSGSTPVQADGRVAKFDCIPQNLTSGGYGMDSFSMGGSQDSTYEYFPKQYLLLGGLVPKYQTMHEKVSDAVKKYMLYRPMIKDGRDILFSAKVLSRDNTDKDLIYTYEITHLTCFLGGMFAMGGRIFDRPEDVEIGSKLADGCAWAYEATPMGVMPEGSTITPCANITHCPWNETAWYDKLDPNSAWRIGQMQEYENKMKEYEEKKDKFLRLQKERAEEEERERIAAIYGELANNSSAPDSVASVQSVPEAAPNTANVGKRSAGTDEASPTAAEEAAIDQKAKTLESDLDLSAVSAPIASHNQPSDKLQNKPVELPVMPILPNRPETHEEFVQHRIERDNLIPGFVSMDDRRYILRPEAIESVWYMYRITGDPSWQEKGWRMFQAVIRATRTEFGHSAIGDVMADPNTEPNQLDNMESFWFAETLKYFYLLFTTPDVISLDDYVLNTEAHPFKRPT